jgi:hypothetical protein
MLLESEHHPSFTSPSGREGGVGSLLQDHIGMDMVDSPIRPHHKERTALDPLPMLDKQISKKRRRCCGLGRKRLAAIITIFIVLLILVWYFVWPRPFDIHFDDANLATDGAPETTGPNKDTPTGIHSVWNVLMTANNQANWVPTHVSRLDLDIYDRNTGVKFANGSVGSFVLPPKAQQQLLFTVNLDYRPPAAQNDTTLENLMASCLVDQQTQGGQPQTQPTLNLMFEVTFHIAGIVWTSSTRQYADKMRCPQ